MLRQGPWKYITYDTLEEYDLLFNIEEDPYELHNCTTEQPDIAAAMAKQIWDGWDPAAALALIRRKGTHHRMLAKWGAAVNPPQPERFIPPPDSLQPPVEV